MNALVLFLIIFPIGARKLSKRDFNSQTELDCSRWGTGHMWNQWFQREQSLCIMRGGTTMYRSCSLLGCLGSRLAAFGSLHITTETGDKAIPYNSGAGQFTLFGPWSPGVVYETIQTDYLSFLCYYGFTSVHIRKDLKTHAQRYCFS